MGKHADLLLGGLLDRLLFALAVRASTGQLVSGSRPYNEIVDISPPELVTTPDDLSALQATDAQGRPIAPSAGPPTAALAGHPERELAMSVSRPEGRRRGYASMQRGSRTQGSLLPLPPSWT